MRRLSILILGVHDERWCSRRGDGLGSPTGRRLTSLSEGRSRRSASYGNLAGGGRIR